MGVFRQEKPSKKKVAPSKTWIWEDDFRIWLTGRDRYLDDTGPSQVKRPLYNLSIPSSTQSSSRSVFDEKSICCCFMIV